MNAKLACRFIIVLASIVGPPAAQAREAGSGVDVVPPPDLRFLDRPFNQCRVEPAQIVPLTQAEKCWIGKLAARCTPADDCLVACLASTKARDLGGGCWHACFEVKFRLSEWSEPRGADHCRALGKVPGM